MKLRIYYQLSKINHCFAFVYLYNSVRRFHIQFINRLHVHGHKHAGCTPGQPLAVNNNDFIQFT